MPEADCFKKPEVGDKVRAEHRIGGDEMPKLKENLQTGFRHLVFRDWCGGTVAIIGFEGSRTRIGCKKCEFELTI